MSPPLSPPLSPPQSPPQSPPRAEEPNEHAPAAQAQGEVVVPYGSFTFASYLKVKSKKKSFNKAWVAFDSKMLYICKTQADFPHQALNVPLMTSKLRMDGEAKKHKNAFDLVTTDNMFTFIADTELTVLQWTALLQDACDRSIRQEMEHPTPAPPAPPPLPAPPLPEIPTPKTIHKAGYLLSLNQRKWKKNWVVLDTDTLFLYKSANMNVSNA
jgi:hypothetical protein